MLGHYMDLNKDLNTVLAEQAVQSTGEIQTCKITYHIHKKKFPAQLFFASFGQWTNCTIISSTHSTADTELRTGLRPQTQELHLKLHSKALSEIRSTSVSAQLISSALTTPPMKRNCLGIRQSWWLDCEPNRCLPCAHKRSHACSKTDDALKVKSWKLVP